MAIYSVRRKYGKPNIVRIQEASASSANDWYAGDLVKVDSSGELVIATAGAIYGIARSAASGTASTWHNVDVLGHDDIITVKYKASATTEGLTTDTVDFTFTANGHTVDESGASTDAVVVGFDPINAIGATGGRLLVKILPAAIQTGAGGK